MSAQAQRQAGQQAKAEANYRAAVARNNAIRAEYAAQDVEKSKKEGVRKQTLKGALLIGQMRAVMGGSGATVNEGSNAQLIDDQQTANRLDVLKVANNYDRRAHALRTQAADFDAEAGLLEFSGANAERNAKAQATGTLLGTVGSVAEKWYGFKRVGGFGSSGGGGSTLSTASATI
jgi:hypothetical protein